MSRSWTASIAPLALATAMCGACGNSSSSGGVGAPCTRTTDCDTGLMCGPAGICTGQDSGASQPDGNAGDAGGLDGRTAD